MEVEYNKNLTGFARELRKKGTLSEKLLWNEIKGKKLGYIFNRQQSIAPNFIVDFLCRSKAAVVEIDGDSHDGKGEYDAKRDELIKAQGLIVIHVHDYEVKKNMGGVLKLIKDCIETRTSTEVVTRY